MKQSPHCILLKPALTSAVKEQSVDGNESFHLTVGEM